MFKMKGPTMIQNSYSPAFPLKHQQKDMRLALALGDENAVSMPVAAAANEVLLFSSFFSWVEVFAAILIFVRYHLVRCPTLGQPFNYFL